MITHAVFTCKCTNIEDNLTIAQIARKSICKVCAEDKKRHDCKIAMRKLRPAIKKRKAEKRNKNINLVKHDDCHKYLECISKVSVMADGAMLDCSGCDEYVKRINPDPADFIGHGRISLPCVGGRPFMSESRKRATIACDNTW